MALATEWESLSESGSPCKLFPRKIIKFTIYLEEAHTHIDIVQNDTMADIRNDKEKNWHTQIKQSKKVTNGKRNAKCEM